MKKITLTVNNTFEHQWIIGVHAIPENAIDVTDSVFMILSQDKTKKYDSETKIISDYSVPPKTKEQIIIDNSSRAKEELKQIDLLSIRNIRAWIYLQPTASKALKDNEIAAVLARSKVID